MKLLIRMLQMIAVGLSLSTLGQNQSMYPTKISSNKDFVIMQLPGDAFEDWRTNYSNTDSSKVNPITRQFYSMFKDDFDFIVFAIDQTAEQHQLTGMPLGMNVQVSNDVQGIGIDIFSNGAIYGSAGRLKSYLTLWSRTYMENGPFLHEYCHNWANFIIQANEFSNATPPDNDFRLCGPGNVDSCATATTKAHWGFAGCGGQLGGFDQATLKINVDGDPIKYQAGINGQENFGFNANGGNWLPYSKFELYLMGFIPLSDVPAFDSFTEVVLKGKDLKGGTSGGWNGKFISRKRTTYTPAKIAVDFGLRNPSSESSQKEFKALVVLLTATPIASVTNKSIADIEYQLKSMGTKGDNGNDYYNFWEATGGLGTMTFDLSSSIK